ncbi:MAG TPA: rRNA maturation RNase YbeY [Candidatus Angelobacter sp.]|nr:rRNA maturation RNase YbeY [Candidatus Angelobacter sp.]
MIIFEKAALGVDRPGMVRFARRAQKLAGVHGEVDILITGNRRIQKLNRRFRKKNKPTDVLSFPRDGGGDIAISADIARQNAARYRHSAANELKILVLHGMLHLAGFNHETDNGSMAKLESKLRARLKLPASLIDRAQAPPARARSTARRSR